MAKEGEELWDDSALINAYEQAVSNYKRMQKNKKKHAGSSEDKAGYANATNHVGQILEDERYPGTLVNGVNMSNAGLEDNGGSLVYETNCIVTYAPEIRSNSQGIPTQDELQEHVDPSIDDYTKLYNEYYKIEEKKQQILVQLQQFSSGSLSSQELEIAGEQASHSATSCPFCSCVSHYVVLPCSTIPCSLVGRSICKMCGVNSEQLDYKKSSPVDDNDIVIEAMAAAERAISSMKLSETGEKEPEKQKIEMRTAGTSETDLSAVFNAWYSAGFCTGKYLVEQSIEKKDQS